MQFSVIVLLAVSVRLTTAQRKCPNGKYSATTASGTKAPAIRFCPGDLIFLENFDQFDSSIWKRENTLGGGGNQEFQWYTNNPANTQCKGGVLHMTPTLTEDSIGKGSLESGRINLGNKCTNDKFDGCTRTGLPGNILHPVRSARISLMNSFRFKYGTLEVRAKIPTGDWLWPAIWLLPRSEVYGTWPASGEIDLLESRGNLNYRQNGVHVGVEQIGQTLNFGPNNPIIQGFPAATQTTNSQPNNGYNKNFHNYKLRWTPQSITFYIDGVVTKKISAGTGFWNLGNFGRSGAQNPWRSGSTMAPFDKEFYLIMNLAVGGTNNYFNDQINRPHAKPWTNSEQHPKTSFWNARHQWLPTWTSSSFQISFVKIWAL